MLNLKHADEQDAGQNSYARTITPVNQEITLWSIELEPYIPNYHKLRRRRYKEMVIVNVEVFWRDKIARYKKIIGVSLETSWSISCTSGGQLKKSLLSSINLAFRINHQRLWVHAIFPRTEIWQIWQIWDSERSIVKRRTIQQNIRSEPNIKPKKIEPIYVWKKWAINRISSHQSLSQPRRDFDEKEGIEWRRNLKKNDLLI